MLESGNSSQLCLLLLLSEAVKLKGTPKLPKPALESIFCPEISIQVESRNLSQLVNDSIT